LSSHVFAFCPTPQLNRHGPNLIFLKNTQVLTPFGIPQVAQSFRQTQEQRLSCYDYIWITSFQKRGRSFRTDM